MRAIDRGRIPASMETCVANSDGNKVVLRDGINHLCVGIADGRARSEADLRTSTGKIGFHSVVKITPAEPVKRLGTGRHWWFSESIHVPSKLRSAIEGGEVNSMPYLEALSGVLAHEVSRVHQGVAREPPVSRGGLARWRKRVVVDCIEEHLGKQVCLLKGRGINEA